MIFKTTAVISVCVLLVGSDVGVAIKRNDELIGQQEEEQRIPQGVIQQQQVILKTLEEIDELESLNKARELLKKIPDAARSRKFMPK